MESPEIVPRRVQGPLRRGVSRWSKAAGPAYLPLVVVWAVLAGGIVADCYVPVPLNLWLVLVGGSFLVWAWCWGWRWNRVAGVVVLVVVGVVGGSWHHLYWRRFSRWEIGRYAAWGQAGGEGSEKGEAGEESEGGVGPPFELDWQVGSMPVSAAWSEAWKTRPVALEAIVKTSPSMVSLSRMPSWYRQKQRQRFRFQVEVCRIRDKEHWRRAAGRLFVRVDALPSEDLSRTLGRGDRIRLFGQLGRVLPPCNPGEYDFSEWVRGERVLCVVSCFGSECIERIGGAGWYEPDRWLRVLDGFRRWGAERFVAVMVRKPTVGAESEAEPGQVSAYSGVESEAGLERARLAGAILLGVREELEPEYTEAFLRTGTVHLLSISGLHVGLIVLIVSFVLRMGGISRLWEIVTIAVFCLGYMVLSGSRAPTVRATVLVELGCAAALLGRKPLGMNSLAAGGIVILALNPRELFRTGTQLSFVSVAVLFALVSEGRLPRLTPPQAPSGSMNLVGSWSKVLQKVFLWGVHPVEGRDSFGQILGRWTDYIGTWFGPLDRADPLDQLILKSMSRPQRLARRCVRGVGFLFVSGAIVWAVVLPIVMARMHVAPLSAVVLNVGVGLVMPCAMASGFLFLVLGWLWAPMGWLLGRTCSWFLWCLERMIHWADGLPGSYFWVPGPGEWWLVGFYGGLAAWVGYFRYRVQARWAGAALTLWIAVGCLTPTIDRWLHPPEPGNWECTFLSVGHGLAVVVHLPDGQTWLYDAGSTALPDRAEQIVAGYLWSRGITHLDAVWISHPDVDHFNGLPGLLERFRVHRVIMSSKMLQEIGAIVKKQAEETTQEENSSKGSGTSPGSSQEAQPPPGTAPTNSEPVQTESLGGPESVSEGKESASARKDKASGGKRGTPDEKDASVMALYEAIRKADAPIYGVCRLSGAECRWWESRDIRVRVFHPPQGGVSGSNNANSLVLGIEAYGRRVLLTGDLEPPGLRPVLSQGDWDCDVVVVPHHGGRSSQPADFAQWCRAECAVISGGPVLSTRTAEAAYRSAGAEIWHTGRHGAVFVQLSRERVQIRSQWKSQPGRDLCDRDKVFGASSQLP